MVEQWMQDMASLLAAAPDQAALASLPDAVQIDLVTALESARASLSAVQARAEVAFRDAQLEEQRRLGVPRKDLGRGIADQLALARRITPKQASDQLTFHRVLVESLPRTLRLLEGGRISDWGANQVARNVLLLDEEDRDRVDEALAPVLPSLTAGAAGRRALALAQSLDPEAAVRRRSLAVASRRVGLRPAPDGMSHLHALVPVEDGVAMIAALRSAAATARATGESGALPVGAVMADFLVERVTGRSPMVGVPIEIQLLMTDRTLLTGTEETATLDGMPLPGGVARGLALGATAALRTPHRTSVPPGTASPPSGIGSASPGAGPLLRGVSSPPPPSAQASSPHSPQSPPADRQGTTLPIAPPEEASRWIRRLYTDPATGELNGMDTRRRFFTGSVRRFISLRDQHCRTPWCDAPIRDIDHVHRAADGGATDLTNGVGHCERFNHVREMPGWDSRLEPVLAPGGAIAPDPAITSDPGAASGKVLRITTPTGHEYTSLAPSLRDALA
ncbi:13E12 repeat family protein [Brachybacterium sp. NBEC-018]|uniref:13E12 repeat family protein n=1 Tax=Brachybacterium sp. NBEC-018 TaxID=2996004 RepID=UPI0021753CC2|nr:13E12 repeat family protein [Brachybacterium sp. NBEC-018]UVY84235.1 13E12 repeat family protein [Brachybacterium sp. NBEC-018]